MRLLDGSPFDVMRGDVLASSPGLAAVLQRECRQALLDLGWDPRP
jgi:myo-inositol-1(or 4)-monophosphatase